MKDQDIDSLMDVISYVWNRHIDNVHPHNPLGPKTDDVIESCEVCRRLSRAVFELLHVDTAKMTA